MSEKRRVIKVDDLFIEAENVVIQPRRDDRHDRHRDNRFDPFFGGRRRRKDDDRDRDRESSSRDHRDESSDRRGGFRWF
ncbi:hypothetical protein [Halobacillus mangrovi]|uniref:Uncharacterized protein n=1 Tax=Halobacillus mangrovi TaxID=402384 RepID=A0A1W5ZXK8_9BACI|nr:hypothetical protein [Halobacillus mangrovi]ARI78000.1 hypothetical protein HM131_14585 [Halobacillus mangrovi]